MRLLLSELCELVEGKIKTDIDENLIISQISPIEDSKEGSLSFLHNNKYFSYLYETKATAVLVNNDFVPENKKFVPVLIYVDDVYSKLVSLLERFNHVNEHKLGIEDPVFFGENVSKGENIYIGAFSYIGKGVKIGNRVKIYPNCYIGENVEIADNSVLYAGVKIYHNCKVGQGCIIHSGAVIGSDGFGHAPQSDGTFKKIPQVGRVIIGDYVEIGANTTIDRATIEATIINSGVKLDNLIQIAHNVEIGANTVISAQAGISGSTKIGKGCMIGGQVGFANHLDIADGSKFGAQSGVAQSIKEKGNIWFGTPVLPLRDTLRLYNIQRKLPDIYMQINRLEKELKSLKQEKEEDGK